MNKCCSRCGREAIEDEAFHMFVDPKSEWWLTLFDNPQYCDECVSAIQKAKQE